MVVNTSVWSTFGKESSDEDDVLSERSPCSLTGDRETLLTLVEDFEPAERSLRSSLRYFIAFIFSLCLARLDALSA